MSVLKTSALILEVVGPDGGSITIRLDPLVWEGVRYVADKQNRTMDSLISEVEATRQTKGLTVALASYVVEFCRAALKAKLELERGPAGHSNVIIELATRQREEWSRNRE